MRIRDVGFSAAAWAALAGAAWGGDSKGKDRPIAIIASPATLKVGERCHVELNAVTSGLKETVTEYDGVIAEANDRGISLTVAEERKTVVVKPLGDKPPFDRLFRNVGIGRPNPAERKEVWLPGAMIRSVRLVESFAPDRPSPPTFQIKPISISRPARPAR